MEEIDFYAVLMVERTASPEEIRKAYRKQALKWHPDKNMDNKDEAETMFKRIAQAYEILSDAEKRAIYDQYGVDGLQGGLGGGHRGPRRSGSRGSGFADFQFHDPFEIFRELFRDFDQAHGVGRGMGGGPGRRTSSSSRHSSSLFDDMDDFFSSPFPSPMFSSPMFGGFGSSDFFGPQDGAFSQGFTSSSFSSNGGGRSRSVSSQTTIQDGKKRTVTRITENGQTTEKVEELDLVTGRLLSSNTSQSSLPAPSSSQRQHVQSQSLSTGGGRRSFSHF